MLINCIPLNVKHDMKYYSFLHFFVRFESIVIEIYISTKMFHFVIMLFETYIIILILILLMIF